MIDPTQLTGRAQICLRRAMTLASGSDAPCGSAHLLAALAEQPESIAGSVLADLGLFYMPARVLNELRSQFGVRGERNTWLPEVMRIMTSALTQCRARSLRAAGPEPLLLALLAEDCCGRAMIEAAGYFTTTVTENILVLLRNENTIEEDERRTIVADLVVPQLHIVDQQLRLLLACITNAHQWAVEELIQKTHTLLSAVVIESTSIRLNSIQQAIEWLESHADESLRAYLEGFGWVYGRATHSELKQLLENRLERLAAAYKVEYLTEPGTVKVFERPLQRADIGEVLVLPPNCQFCGKAATESRCNLCGKSGCHDCLMVRLCCTGE